MEERDLGALIENGLKGLAGRIDESRAETRQLFKKLDVKIDETRTHLEGKIQQIDGKIDETRTHLEAKIQQLDGKIDETRTHLEAKIQQLDGKIDETRTHLEAKIVKLDVQLEYVRGDIRLVAEGVANVNEKLDRHISATAREFEDVRALTRLSYVQLEQRVTKLEHRLEEPVSS